MARPGTTLTRSETRPARSARTGTGPWFIVGPTGTADTDTTEGYRSPCKSLAEYAARFGSRAAHVNDGGGGAPAMYDSAEFYFKEGGAELFVNPATYNATPATYETNIAASLAQFASDLGPGQVSVPGRTTPATRLALAQHVEATGRIGIAASTNTNVVSTLTADATIASVTAFQERRMSLFGPWLTMPGVTSGSTRTMSPEAVVAGLMAKNDGEGVTPNEPSAGLLGESAYALAPLYSFTDVDRATLNLNGVNVLRALYGGVRVYGYRTLADPTSDDNWISLSNARLFMAIEAEAAAIAERYVFRQIDGQGTLISKFGGELTGMLLPYWQRGSLYGTTPAEAFRVDVGPNVNTVASIAAGYLRANVILRVSQFAEEVVIELVKSRITEEVAA
jgi:phage tail sheath protein FI